jgi:uncharacterized protein (DUF4415 family)
MRNSLSRQELSDLMRLSQDKMIARMLSEEIPEEWHMIMHDIPAYEKKEKLTLYLDKSVAKFFKAMGNGYQARINRILATWARMVILEDMELENALRRRLSQTPPEPE